MITEKAEKICAAFGYLRCEECPLNVVCSIPTPELPGETLKDKTAWWEERMNEAAACYA